MNNGFHETAFADFRLFFLLPDEQEMITESSLCIVFWFWKKRFNYIKSKRELLLQSKIVDSFTDMA